MIEIVSEPRTARGAPGSIYLGRVVRRMPGMGAVFVDIGLAQPALLDTGADLPKEGDSFAVQVIEAENAEKAARLTRRVALEGRFAVLMPGGKGVSISRRITDRKLRTRLGETVKPPGAGLIIRSAAADAAPKAVGAEVALLHATWIAVKAALDGAAPPFCALDDGDGLVRILRRFAPAKLPRLVLDDSLMARRAASIAETLFGEAPEVEVESQRGALFERHGIADALAVSESPEVRLPSGGRLILEATSALTAIDVDTGENASATDAPLRTDLEAAAEIARQMRWRNLGGLIVVDFVRLTEKAPRAKLEAALRQAVAQDPAPVQLLGWTAGGLFEMIRPRARTPGAE
jgi:Rne/Rng family ribonuclease